MIDRDLAGPPGAAAFLLLAGWLTIAAPASAQPSGAQLFEDECALCHKIGSASRRAPDLAGITDKMPEDWLVRYIKSPEAVFQSGDPRAKANRANYKTPMDDTELSDADIKAILVHIRGASGSVAAAPAAAAPAARSTAAPSADEIRLGQQLFEGSVRFEKGGPACNACHEINHPAVTGGGILAKDLTHSPMNSEDLGRAFVKPSFAVMRVAYQATPISGGETKALAAFMQQADQQVAAPEPRSYGWRMFLGGIAGLTLALGLLAAGGRRRKKRSVNQEIYDRQVRSG
jgi:mono/diheme cytochrome c family protein